MCVCVRVCALLLFQWRAATDSLPGCPSEAPGLPERSTADALGYFKGEVKKKKISSFSMMFFLHMDSFYPLVAWPAASLRNDCWAFLHYCCIYVIMLKPPTLHPLQCSLPLFSRTLKQCIKLLLFIFFLFSILLRSFQQRVTIGPRGDSWFFFRDIFSGLIHKSNSS